MGRAMIPILLGPTFLNTTATPSYTAQSINGSAVTLAYMFEADEAMTITQVGFRQNTVTGTPGVLRCSLQGVDATGAQDGTILASGSAYVDYTPTSGNNTRFNWFTLGASVTVTRGQLLSFVLAPFSGTWDASNLLSVHNRLSNISMPQGLPYLRETSTKVRGVFPVFGYASSTRSYGGPVSAVSTVSVNTGTTPDEVGVRFTLPSSWGSTYTIRGIEVLTAFPTGTTMDMVLYSGTTALQTRTGIDTDVSPSASPTAFRLMFTDTTLATLSFGTEYVITLRPGGATSHAINYYDVIRAQDLGAMHGGAIAASYTSRTDAGAFSDTATRMLHIALLIDDWTVSGSSAVGPLVGPGRLAR